MHWFAKVTSQTNLSHRHFLSPKVRLLLMVQDTPPKLVSAQSATASVELLKHRTSTFIYSTPLKMSKNVIKWDITQRRLHMNTEASAQTLVRCRENNRPPVTLQSYATLTMFVFNNRTRSCFWQKEGNIPWSTYRDLHDWNLHRHKLQEERQHTGQDRNVFLFMDQEDKLARPSSSESASVQWWCRPTTCRLRNVLAR